VPEGVKRWLDLTDSLLRPRGQRVEPYERHALAEGATMYAAPGTPDERASRTLVVAFCGDAQRLMMPIALFLQQLPAAKHELMLLVDRTRRFYLGGVAGLGDGLPATIRRIGELAAPAKPRRTVAFGTSAGGLAALWTAVELGMTRGVSVGGISTESVPERVHTQHFDTRGFDDAVRRCVALPDIVLVSGERNVRDTEKALSMAARLPARHVVVPGPRTTTCCTTSTRTAGSERCSRS
jgi:hypothetical protein